MLAQIHRVGTGVSVLSATEAEGAEVEVPGVLKGFLSWPEIKKVLKAHAENGRAKAAAPGLPADPSEAR